MNAFCHCSHEDEMKTNFPKKTLLLLVAVLALLFPVSAATGAQDPAQQPDTQQGSPNDPIRQLNLTPEQRQKIRAITEDNREERVRINRRLREAQFALEQTLDGDSPSEAAVEDRIREVSNAQAAQIRMRALTELKIRSVLTPEQLRVWRELRAERRNLRREMNNPNNVRQGQQRNGIAPLFPGTRRNALRIRRQP